jgi:hypothetical protein
MPDRRLHSTDLIQSANAGNVGLPRSKQTLRFRLPCLDLLGPKQLQVGTSFLTASFVVTKTESAEAKRLSAAYHHGGGRSKTQCDDKQGATTRTEREANAIISDQSFDSDSTPQHFGPRPASLAVSGG